jgi:hypothetical protein
MKGVLQLAFLYFHKEKAINLKIILQHPASFHFLFFLRMEDLQVNMLTNYQF